ncbi:MFS transporter [Methylophilaceae bacterium]|nr:MFS transporter [Methylophilaceae bacterium]|tara:strand:- start:1221 stop:2396 length:1176 start_codon:yes stop_codon:yes gene_type:complete
MSPLEIKSSVLLASIYSLRMLGIFLILPIFSIYASELSGRPTEFQIGLAFGIYGLTQAILQIPFGMTSDRLGRKPVIYFGLLLFIIGSFIAGISDHIEGVIIGRAIQGSGAISAVLTAFLSDLTSDKSRTKGMAIIGVSIGLTFALSLVISPILNNLIGVPGIFLLMGILAFIALGIVKFFIDEPLDKKKIDSENASGIKTILKDFDLNRLNFGIFVLHASQISMFMAIPFYLINQGEIPLNQHWVVYLAVLAISFIFLIPMIIFSEKNNKTRESFIFSIALLFVTQFLFIYFSNDIVGIIIALIFYFIGFNYLEASLPSLVSKLAPIQRRGLALGVYNSSQSLGIFVGGTLGGLIANFYGYQGTFLFCSLLIMIWLFLSITMKMPIKNNE